MVMLSKVGRDSNGPVDFLRLHPNQVSCGQLDREPAKKKSSDHT